MLDMLKHMLTKRRIVLLIMTVALLCGAVYTVASTKTENSMKTGAVEVNLKQYHLQGGKETEWSGKASVMPGEKVSLIPRVHNKGMDCYIRVKLTFRETDKVNESHLQGIGKNWTKSDDGFYYYKKALKQNEYIDIFKSLNIPKNLPKSMENQKFYLDIDVHAIQARNFEPEFEMAEPWGSVEIVEHTKEGDNDYTSFQEHEGKAFEIICQGGSKDILQNADDFFAKIPHLMPGDTYTESLHFENKTNREIKLYFRSILGGESELPEKINLKITMKLNGKQTIIYDGRLHAGHFENDSMLAKLPAGAEGEFIFELHIPEQLNNAYSLHDSDIKWVFSTKAMDGDFVVNTGDNTNIVIYIVLAGLALAALAIMIIIKRKKNEAEEQQDDNICEDN